MSDPSQYINNIDPTFPTPGKDNNTQGFRSNFANIQQALTTLNQNINGISATTVNVNAPKVTATQSMTSLGPLYFGTQTFAYVTTVDNKLTVAGVNSAGQPAAGEIAFSPSIVTISTNPNSVATDSTGTYFVTSSPTIGLLVGGVFYCPSTGTGPFRITNIIGNKIYFTGSGGLDPSVDVTNPVFNKNTVLTTSTVIPFFGQGFPGSIIVASTKNSSASTSGSLVVGGGVGIAKNLNVDGCVKVGGGVGIGGTVTINGNLSVAGNINFGVQGNFIAVYNDGSTGATSFGYQKLPGGLILAWGYSANVPTRGTARIDLPTFSGNVTAGFPNAIMNVQVSPSVSNLTISHYDPVTLCFEGVSFISSRRLVTDVISGSFGVNNLTKTGFNYSYYQNIVQYNCTSAGLINTVKYLNTAAIYWSAIGY
jgi:hypothetical protein